MAVEKNDALIMRRKAYREILGISVTTGWRWEKEDPTFPKPVKVGKNRAAFRMSELQAWINSRQRVEAP